MKIAFLVTFAPTTRVVVDVENASLEQGDDFIKVVTAARQQIIKDGIAEYLNGDNINSINIDEEFPYPQEYDDKL